MLNGGWRRRLKVASVLPRRTYHLSPILLPAVWNDHSIISISLSLFSSSVCSDTCNYVSFIFSSCHNILSFSLLKAFQIMLLLYTPCYHDRGSPIILHVLMSSFVVIAPPLDHSDRFDWKRCRDQIYFVFLFISFENEIQQLIAIISA